MSKIFKEALEEEELKEFQKDARCFSLLELPDKTVKSYTYHFDEFEYAIINQKRKSGDKDLSNEPNRNYTNTKLWNLNSPELNPLKEFLLPYFK